MAENDNKPRDRKNEPWVIEQARREVEAAQAAVDSATNDIAKKRAQEDLKQAKARLQQLLRTARRDARVDKRLEEAQADLKAAQKTADPEDDKEAQARVDRLTEKSSVTETKKIEAQDKADAYFLSEMGPMVAEAMQEFPELREFFRQAIAGNWDAAKQQRELNNPDQAWYKFWQSKGSYWRAGFQLQFGPNATEGTWGDKVKEAKEKISAAAVAAGVVLDPTQLDSLARRYWYSNWQNDDAALTSYMQKRAKNPNQEVVTNEDGTAALTPLQQATASGLRDLAESYGITLSQSSIDEWVTKMNDPKVNVNKIIDDQFLQYLVNESRSRYGGLGDRIDENTNLRQLTGGYMSTLARMLELDPSSLRLDEGSMDPLLKRALTGIGESGKPELMPLWKFEQEIKKDARWQYTTNALDTYSSIGSDLARMMGFVR